MKAIIGIQCIYYDSFKGKYIQSEPYFGNLEEDAEFKELELKEDDYFTKFYVDYGNTIKYLKFISKGGMAFEIGEEGEGIKKSITLNQQKEP